MTRECFRGTNRGKIGDKPPANPAIEPGFAFLVLCSLGVRMKNIARIEVSVALLLAPTSER